MSRVGNSGSCCIKCLFDPGLLRVVVTFGAVAEDTDYHRSTKNMLMLARGWSLEPYPAERSAAHASRCDSPQGGSAPQRPAHRGAPGLGAEGHSCHPAVTVPTQRLPLPPRSHSCHPAVTAAPAVAAAAASAPG